MNERLENFVGIVLFLISDYRKKEEGVKKAPIGAI
jgi:hypothetical protein